MAIAIHPSNRRTLHHGAVTIVAERPGVVHVGNVAYTVQGARQLAEQTPAGPGSTELIAKLLEQANWADGQDL